MENSKGDLYIIQIGSVFKVGRSVDVDRRLTELRSNPRWASAQVVEVHKGAGHIEKLVHNELARWSIPVFNGSKECFGAPLAEIQSVIEQLKNICTPLMDKPKKGRKPDFPQKSLSEGTLKRITVKIDSRVWADMRLLLLSHSNEFSQNTFVNSAIEYYTSYINQRIESKSQHPTT